MSINMHTRDKNYILESNLRDIELIRAFNTGDEYAFNSILDLHLNTIKTYASLYFAPGLTKSDLIQEGRIGLYKAVVTFHIEKGSNFKSYARIHIKSKIINAVKIATRKKQQFLSNSLSLDEQVSKNSNNINPLTRYDFISHPTPSPEDIFIEIVEMEYKRDKLTTLYKSLSRLEKSVLKLWLQKMSYKDISRNLSISPKSVDNAMRRIIKKCSMEDVFK